ncbi:hypothetical protein ABZZ16_02400 [Streptomyces sp. NPDC006386]|uniref:hypothetical protein n=1 Tax=Streptomyces sp. NPDC006386 TaxID=3156762 RepID=UPI0033A2F3F5
MLWGKRWERSVAAGRDVWLAVTGDHNRLFFTRQVRSAYWEQVRRIAPAELLGRERELAELAAFCTADSGPAYAWWRAEAWAGKTALLSWFALNPPAGVRIVPFFVTARLGAQNDVAAYVDVVLEQLAELAGEDLPALLTKATREAHLLHLYRAAARACAERGERLVLLLDGLDEDRGVTTGPEAHSIAGLLPALPESGMRVLVAGRRNPPLPVDVPEDHPLRDPAIVSALAPSPYARTIRAEAERELKRLIEAGGLEYDLLALVTAANGGLTAEDLSALTGEVPYRVRDVLRTRAGRTFGVRLNVYLLAHEELQRRALDMLGTAELDRHRARLHAWADTWRDRGWPDGTPDYLLAGYFGLLREARDLRRAVDCAVDAVRHDRMLDVTGGDAAALAEIRNAEEMVAEAGVPDLTDLVRLSLRREELEHRNDSVTRTFPWAWAVLGRVRRAEALARSIPSLDWRAMALADVAAVVLDAGEHAEAVRLLEEAEQAAERYAFDYDIDEERDLALVEVSRGWAKAGLFDRAESLVTTVAGVDLRVDLLVDLVRSLVAAGAFDRAGELCRRQDHDLVRGLGLAAAAAALTEAGHLDRAKALAQHADHAARPLVLARIAGVLRRTGREGGAEALLTAVEAALTPSDLLIEVVEALADLGEFDRAERAALLHDDAAARGWALRGVVRALAATGDGARAEALAERIEHPAVRSGAVPAIVEGLAEAGAHEEAERLARDLTDEEARDTAVRAVVDALIRAGETDRAERLAGEDTATEPGAVALCGVIEGRARAGELDRAFEMARSLGSTDGHEALVRGAVVSGRAPDELAELVARAETEIRRSGRGGSLHPAHTAIILAEAGLGDAARAVLDRVGVPALVDPDDPGEQVWAGRMAQALAHAGRFDAAEELVRRLGNRPGGAFALTPLIERLCAAKEFDRALAFVAGLDDRLRDHPRAEIAVALADAGAVEQAVSLARDVTDAGLRARCRARIAVALAAAGDWQAAEDAFAEAVSPGERHTLWVAPDLLRAYFTLGRTEEGERLLARLDDGPPGFSTAVVSALVEAGEYERARELTRRPGWERNQALLVTMLVEAGRPAHAEEVARALDAADARPADAPASALVRAWVALAPVVEPARGRALVARALRHETLQEVLPAIVRLEPEAVPLIVDVLGRSTRHGRPTAARTSAPS